MKKLFFVAFLSLCCGISASPIRDHKIDPASLAQLAKELDIQEDENIVAETQKRWLRKPNLERWEMAELAADKRAFVLNWSEENGLFKAWTPACESYDKALLLGGTTCRMQLRLDYLIKLWHEGTRFSEIVWLTGDRPLDKRVDDLTDRCTNESEAAVVLWSEADLPEEMRALPIVFIAVPMKAEGKRPTTEDTILAWLKESPTPCKALFVSNQPFCGYQFSVIKACMPQAYAFEVVGPGVESTEHPAAAAIILDSLARWIYQENQIQQKCQPL